LRPLARRDLDPWAEFLADPLATRLLHFPEPHSRDLSERLLERTIARAAGDIAMYAVRVRASGDVAGFVGYAPRQLEWGGELELGWLLLRPFHGCGYATEAARPVRMLVPGRVISLIRVENEASQNVARMIGMTAEREVEFAGFRTHVFASHAP
jgi:RimJ/RimL family protein N-acetyltransferase